MFVGLLTQGFFLLYLDLLLGPLEKQYVPAVVLVQNRSCIFLDSMNIDDLSISGRRFLHVKGASSILHKQQNRPNKLR
jgi:hypothetical protein